MKHKFLKFYLIKIKEVFSFLTRIRFVKIKSNKNILIYGISRGGTTLLAETLVKLLNARLVWEPLFPHNKSNFSAINPYSVEQYSKFQLGWHPHIASENDKAVNSYFDEFFSLKIRNIRFYRFTNPKTFKSSNYTIHKFCFGNFMYSYFQKRYNFKSIILLRHPFAIAASSLGFGDNYNWHKENFDSWSYTDSKKSGDFFKGYLDKYDLIVSGFSLLVFQAVTQFIYALSHIDKDNSIIVYYEDLVQFPEEAFKAIQKISDQPLDYNLFLRMLSRQSFSSQKNHTKKNTMEQLSKWKTVASDKDFTTD
ncbi:sulfotransferase domain-containing protein [Winogradskyella sp. PG-2]|uniref:sulfotransferase domain-containing protein n=1 Tax=Winogradskyella sp. PG-2 TaxID=754409 RepID=UPI000458707B|nr:sulfotransferase domain-containing protein [Winogradskyella sp. PG-2]BAO76193.1 hypothetical protein WPG_1963 [Winogradskyella sp. PG-2]